MLEVILLRLVLLVRGLRLSVLLRAATELSKQLVFVIQQATHHGNSVWLSLDDLTFAWGWLPLSVFRLGGGFVLSFNRRFEAFFN